MRHTARFRIKSNHKIWVLFQFLGFKKQKSL